MGSFSVARPTIQPIEQPDLLQNYGRLLQLKGLQQQQAQQAAMAPYQQQALQQQVEAGGLENQQRQQALKDQQAATQAMQEWDGKSIDELPALMIKKGASAQAVMGLKKSALEMKAQASKIAADDATTGAKNVETLTKKNDMVVGALSSLKDVPDEQLPQAITAKAQELAQQGLLDPQHVQMAQQLAQSGNPQTIRASLLSMEKGMTSFSQALEQAKQQEAARHNTALEAQAAATAANTQAYQHARIGIESGNLALNRQKAMLDMNASSTTGEDYLKTLPAGVQAQVKAMANGDIAIPPPGTRNPQAQQLRTAVLTYDPTYTDARYKGKQQFKTSGDATDVVRLSTAMEHADRALQNNSQVGFAPALGNKTFEAPSSAAYMQDAEFLTGEVGKLVKNGVLTVEEGNKISSGMTSARESVRKAALDETMDLLGGRVRSMFQKYQNATGQNLPVNEFFDQKSQQRLQKYGLLENSSPQTPSVVKYKIVNGQLVPE